jgi:hypothetical protein
MALILQPELLPVQVGKRRRTSSEPMLMEHRMDASVSIEDREVRVGFEEMPMMSHSSVCHTWTIIHHG